MSGVSNLPVGIRQPELDMRPAFKFLLKDLGFSRKSIWYVTKRLNNEGVSFLTKKLPLLSKHILLCIELGSWQPFEFSGSSPFKTKGSERYTYFLYDELCSIFSERNHKDSALNLWRVRQLCEYCYKLCLPFAPGQLEEAERKFLATESSINYCATHANKMRKIAESLFVKTKKQTISDVIPHCRFGPGTFSSYDSFRGSNLQSKKDFLDGFYDPKYNAVKGAFRSRKTSLLTGARKRLNIKRYDVQYSEVLFVPKDSRGPRTIVREPCQNIFWQMGLHTVIRSTLQEDTLGRIQFDSQEEFRTLARQSSITGEYATIDLSEASDSVSFGLAEAVFQNFPAISWSLRHARTAYCKMPSGTMHKLSKLSGMGSGFTFPIMAGVIFTSILAACPKRHRAQLALQLHVYGDDIIIPKWALSYGLCGLSLAGMKVNVSKSYWRSAFRESCGGDYFRGECVTPIRLKQLFVDNSVRGCKVRPARRKEFSTFILKLERHCRELVKNGLILLANYYYEQIEKWVNETLPKGSGESPALVRYSLLPVRRNPCTVKAILPSAVRRKTSIYGYDRSFRNKLIALAEDSLGVTESLPFGLDSERRDINLSIRWVSDLVLTGHPSA